MEEERFNMISIREAEELIQYNTPQPKTEKLETNQSLGLVLAEDIYAPCASPGFTNSAMDGFAVRWDDVKGSSENNPIKLNIIGESQAGIPFPKSQKSGEAVRINTGAKVPPGSDSVIPIEDCHDDKSSLEIYNVKRKSQNIRFEGEEFLKGSLLLEKGSLIRSRQLALLVSMGIPTIEILAKPFLSVIVTGSELVDYGKERKDFQICDINTPMLSSLINESGGCLASVKRVPDNIDTTIDSIKKAAELSDFLIISGGVSVGPHDFVKKAAEVCGFKRIFWKVDQKPGKPFYFARKNDKLLFGLPGNPVSAYMVFFHYIRPVLAKMCGKSGNRKPSRMVLGQDYFVKGERKEFLRLSINNGFTKILSQQGSHMLTSISVADGYIIVDGNTQLEKGMTLDVYPFPDRRP
jgi:molybdopterin molybdotransferase